MNDRVAAAAVPQHLGWRVVLISYLQLTKPSIMLLVLVTGAVSLVLEGSLLAQPVKFVLVLLGLYLTGGCANAMNQYLEREVDARMTRTKRRRPLPMHKISGAHALGFAVAIGVIGVTIFGVFFNWLTALLSLVTIVFYSFMYTLWLKPTTWQNIVIGGVAGAMAPVGAWTAATGATAWTPWLLFAIVFLWTPPHFWSLALFIKDDYAKVGYPMLPVVRGTKATLNQILIYTALLVPVSLAPVLTGSGWLYLALALWSGSVFLHKAIVARRSEDVNRIRGLFRYSIVYLFTICAALAVDRLAGS